VKNAHFFTSKYYFLFASADWSRAKTKHLYVFIILKIHVQMKNTYYHIIRILLVDLEITLLIIQELKEHAPRMQEICMK